MFICLPQLLLLGAVLDQSSLDPSDPTSASTELIVGGALLWNSFQMSKNPHTVEVGTRLVFKYASYHNVWLMGSQSAWDDCNFDDAVELAGENQGGGTSGSEVNLYQTVATMAGKLLLACQVSSHCAEGQKVQITVVPPSPSSPPSPPASPPSAGAPPPSAGASPP